MSQLSKNKSISQWKQTRFDFLQKAFSESYCNALDEVVHLITQTFKSNNKILIYGNGGSASDAQHIAAELVGRFYLERKALNAIALTCNTSILTAVANDYAYDVVFSRQIEALAKPGDIVWGLSTSGNSPNVLVALQEAKKLDLRTIVMAGNNGGLIKEFSDFKVFVEDDNTARIQEVHLITYHYICEQIESCLFSKT